MAYKDWGNWPTWLKRAWQRALDEQEQWMFTPSDRTFITDRIDKEFQGIFNRLKAASRLDMPRWSLSPSPTPSLTPTPSHGSTGS
jgi:hypothetical protein